MDVGRPRPHILLGRGMGAGLLLLQGVLTGTLLYRLTITKCRVNNILNKLPRKSLNAHSH